MDETEVREWFGEYLEALASRGRGDSDDVRSLLRFYAVPLLVTTSESARAHISEDEVLAFARQMVDGMRATGYARTVTTTSEVTTLNGTSAIYKGEFTRERADGSEIGRIVVTYLILREPTGPRIFATAVH